MKPHILDPHIKSAIKNDIEHLYLTGLTTMNSLSKTYGVTLLKLSQLQKEVIDEMMSKSKVKKYFPSERELLLGELGRGDRFILKEYQGTKYAHQFYEFIEIDGKNVLVKSPTGKQENMPYNSKVILKTSLTSY